MNVEPRNYGFAGLAVTLPRLIRVVDSELTQDLVEHDEMAHYAALTLVDLTEGIYTLGKILRADGDSKKIHNRTRNNSKYQDLGGTLSYIKGKLAALMNHIMVIGQDALPLLETMHGHACKVTSDECDEMAYGLARGCYKGVTD